MESPGAFNSLRRIAEALEALAARKPAPRVVIIPVPGNYSPDAARELASMLRKALEEE